MADNKLNEIIATTLDSIRAIADTGTIVGEPIPTNNGTVIIPVSKVSLGFASGGVDYFSKTGPAKQPSDSANAASKETGVKTAAAKAPCFGGGGGTGITVTPICFLIVKSNGNVDLLNIQNPQSASPVVSIVDSVSTLIERTPDLISQIKNLFPKKKDECGLDDAETAKKIGETEKNK